MAEIEINKQNKETKSTPDITGGASQSGKTSGQSAKSTGGVADKLGNAANDIAKDTTKEVINKAKETAGDITKNVYDKAKEATSDVAENVYNKATKTASSIIDQQKSSLAEDLSRIAESILQFGNSMRGEGEARGIASASAGYVNTVADNIEQVSKYLNNSDLSEMLEDTKEFAHRNPALFLGAAFGLGILAARFLKSSNSNQSRENRFRYQRKSNYLPENSEGGGLSVNPNEQAKSTAGENKVDNASASNAGDNKSANAASQNKGV